MRRLRPAGIALIAVVLVAGCGSSGGYKTTPSGSPGLGRTCSSLSGSDVQKLIGVPPHVRALTSPPGERIDCGSMFFGQTGDIVVVVTQRPGGSAALAQLQKADKLQYGSTRSLPELGPGAFLAGKRILAFRHGDTVVQLETGIEPNGSGALTPAQLERLAQVVASHL